MDSSRASDLKQYLARIGKPVVFTEIGFNNLDGVASRPWYWSGNNANLDNLEQAACYHAVLGMSASEDWLDGMFWWTWEPGEPPAPDVASYSPQSKLAELILEAYLRSTGAPVCPEK